MRETVRTISDYAAEPEHSVAEAIWALSAVTDRGIWSDGRMQPWSAAVDEIAVRISALRGLVAGSPAPHVGVLLPGVPEFLHLLGAAACSELVVAGLNSTRRGPALGRDIALADCAVVITDAEHEHLLDDAELDGIPVLLVDSPEYQELLHAHRGAALPEPATVPVGPDDLVALIFTSGTSGDPKAVRITHSKIAIPGRMLADRFGIGRDDCVYSAMPLFHSNAVMVAWPVSLFSGCSIAVRRRFSASAWLSDVRRYGCTFANYVGAPLSYILATAEADDDADNPMRAVYGNEAPPAVRHEFSRRFDVRVVDGFGSSEGGISVTRTPETPDDALGPLQPGVHIRDVETGEVCPVARFDDEGRLLNAEEAIGEMVADGPGMFAGYYNDPAADAERMRGGRFHSGDLAYRDAEGFVYFAGRSSGWLRVDGENLGAAPIERALLRHPEVAEVAVYAVPATLLGGGVGDAVAAAVVVRSGADRTEFAAGFADFARSQNDLGAKQQPRVLRLCAALPRTASFKVRPRELSTMGLEAGSAGDSVWVLQGSGDEARFVPVDPR